ncbi:MAG: FYDLN acid domain-containing protein [Myxococcota bacterium]
MEPERKERLGKKWACYACGVKFYDLKKPEPVCPKCEADQRESPVFDKKTARTRAKTARKARPRKKATPRKRAPLPKLAQPDDEVAAPPVDEIDASEVSASLVRDD